MHHCHQTLMAFKFARPELPCLRAMPEAYNKCFSKPKTVVELKEML